MPARELGGAHLAFFGFATSGGMHRLAHTLLCVLAPALLQVAAVAEGRFEGIVSVPARGGAARAERVLAGFKMHIGVVELDAYMSDGMAACLWRIMRAPGPAAGNLLLPAGDALRRDLEAHAHARLPRGRGPREPRAGYEAPENVFLHARSVLYTPTHMLRAA